MDAETRRVLELFVEKANKLRASRFTKIIQTRPTLSVRVLVGVPFPEGMEVDWGELTAEDVDAAMLTLRFFFQKSEPISFRALERLLDDQGLSDDWKQKYQEARKSVNEYLDSTGDGMIFGEVSTKREIFETFLNGDLAHTNNRRNRQTFEMWRELGFVFQFLWAEFINIVIHLLNNIYYVATASSHELGQPPYQGLHHARGA